MTKIIGLVFISLILIRAYEIRQIEKFAEHGVIVRNYRLISIPLKGKIWGKYNGGSLLI